MSSNFSPLLIYDENLLNKHSKIIRQKATYLLIPVFSCKKSPPSKPLTKTLLSPSCVKFITRSAICGYRNAASKLLSTSKTTLKISPYKKTLFSNLNLYINHAGTIHWPTRSQFNIITAVKQLQRGLKVWILNLWAVIFLNNPSQSNRQNVCKLFQNSHTNTIISGFSPVLRTNLSEYRWISVCKNEKTKNE